MLYSKAIKADFKTLMSVCASLPWTVVVHPAHTMTTPTAVMGPFGSHEVALIAQLPVLPLCDIKTTIRALLSLLYSPYLCFLGD